MKRIDALLSEYGSYHRTRGNLVCHAFGITLIVYGVLALLRQISIGGFTAVIQQKGETDALAMANGSSNCALFDGHLKAMKPTYTITGRDMTFWLNNLVRPRVMG